MTEQKFILPWIAAIRLFRYQLANLLLNKHRMERKEALEYLDRHLNTYDPELHQMMDELIEAYSKGEQ